MSGLSRKKWYEFSLVHIGHLAVTNYLFFIVIVSAQAEGEDQYALSISRLLDIPKGMRKIQMRMADSYML